MDQAQQALDLEDATEGMGRLYCGTVATDGSGPCVREAGHSGRHKYRSLFWQGQSLN